MWFVFAVVGTGFTRFRYLPLVTMAIAIVLQYGIAQIPQGLDVFNVEPGKYNLVRVKEPGVELPQDEPTGGTPIDIPKGSPNDQTTFFASMVNRFGVAVVIAFVATYLTNLSKNIAVVEEAGRLLGDTVSERDAAREFLWKASELLGLT
jgi:hypothetical protein